MKKYHQNLIPALFLLSLLAIWEGAVRILKIPLYVLPSPVQVIQTLLSELDTLSRHAGVTVAEAVCGMVISLILALILGILMDCFPVIRQGLYPPSGGYTDGPHDCDGSDSYHLSGIWHDSKDSDRGSHVLFSHRSQLF